jgi:hypothetical protein
MTLTFRYKAVKRPDGTISRTPSIPIVLVGNEIIPSQGLLDSGSDISAISKDLAELLGLKLDGPREPAFGIGGKVDSVQTSIAILIQQGHEKYKFNVPVKVILGPYDFPVLLGRTGFFDKFIISFDQAGEKVSLKRISRWLF